FFIAGELIAQRMGATAVVAIGLRWSRHALNSAHSWHFKRFDPSRYGHLVLVLELVVVHLLGTRFDGVHAIGQLVHRAHSIAMVLHGHAHGIGHILDFFPRRTRLDLVDAIERVVDGGFRDGLMSALTFGMRTDNMVACRTAEDNEVEQ